MKIGIDSYRYHRYFGEVYDGIENPPKYEMNLEDFIKRTIEIEGWERGLDVLEEKKY